MSESLTVREIIRDYLIRNKYDGLACSVIECGCSLEELEICDYNMGDCVPAYKCKDMDCTRAHKCFLVDLNKKICDEID